MQFDQLHILRLINVQIFKDDITNKPVILYFEEKEKDVGPINYFNLLLAGLHLSIAVGHFVLTPLVFHRDRFQLKILIHDFYISLQQLTHF